MENEAFHLAKKLMSDSIWKSTNLEELGTSFQKVEAILSNVRAETSAEEVLFILNMRKAWVYLLNNLGNTNCLQTLKDFNKIISDGLYLGGGKLRTEEVSISGTSWKPEILNADKVALGIKELSKVEDAEERALQYFCFIARGQLFINGNKRVAQLMANKVLVENNIGIFQVPINASKEFGRLLIGYYESGNSKDIIAFMRKYCIRRINGNVEQYSEVGNSGGELKFKDVGETAEFKMSLAQIELCDKVLYNLRRLLQRDSVQKAMLYDNNGVACLLADGRSYKLGDGNAQYDEFITKTLELIETKIPLPVKSIDFSVLVNNFTYGRMEKSREEQGSVDLVLY